MRLSLSQAAFFFGTTVYLLLLLLLGDSYINPILLGSGSLWLCGWSWATGSVGRWWRLNSWSKTFLVLNAAWLFFLIWLGVSTLFTVSLPLSLTAISYWVFVWLLFWQVFVLREWFKPEWWIYIVVLVASLMVVLSTTFLFIPSIALLLPGMNLLYATYGHNHLAALLLLVIPLSWWLAITHYKTPGAKFWLALPVLLTIGLLISFGRVGVVVGLGELIVLGWWWRTKISKPLMKYTYIVLMIIFGLLLMTKVGLSFVALWWPEFQCPVPALAQKLCKPIATEVRPAYWQRAIELVKEYPLFGSGPGTFGVSSKKYQQTPWGATAFAHNAFLQQAAETGVIGGIALLVLVSVLLFFAGKNAQQPFSLQRAVLLGVVALSCNVLFDFDWNFIGILSCMMLLMAIAVTSTSPDAQVQKRKQFGSKTRLFFGIHLGLMHILAVGLMISAGLYISVEWLLARQEVEKAVAFFPYFQWHRKIFEQHNGISASAKKRVFTVYANHADSYTYQLQQTTDVVQRQLLLERLVQLDPWQIEHHDLSIKERD